MRISSMSQTFSLTIFVLICTSVKAGNPDAKRLYDDLLSNYNKLVRPVVNVSEAVTVRLKLKLSQLIDVNLKNQIMTTNLWVEQYWYDYKLQWDPTEYGGVDMLHVPSDHIWRPDIVLYNNADGNFEVTLATKATLMASGKVEWKPPAIYHSSCEMDVEYFPFDEQTCVMKFGSWTYDGYQVDLRHIDEVMGKPEVEIGVDLTEFYMSVEWDILEVPAIRNVKYYTCCDEPYLDITFNVTMRRKTLFYTVNLIIPCMGISFLTVLVFYLPSDSGEKVSLSISILLSLTVFFLLLAEIIPPTSLVVPLLGKFVLFTMILDTFSICVTVVVLNIHFRTPQTHTMAPWIRRVFIHILPRLLVMRRPHYDLDKHRSEVMKNPRYTFMTPDNEYLDEHEVAELLNSADMQDYLHQQRQYQKMSSSNRQYHYHSSKHNHVPNNTRMNHSSLHNRTFSRITSPPQTHNRILVRTCNGLELRDPPYISNSSGGGYLTTTTTTTNNAINRGNVFQQLNKTSSSFDDIIPPFVELPPRAKSSMSHHSFKSTRSFHEDQNDLQGGLPLNGSCRLHGHSADHLPLRSNNQQQRIKFNSFDRMNKLTGSPTADSEMGDNWKHSSSHHNNNNNTNNLNKSNNHSSDVCPEVSKALSGVMLIAEQKKRLEESTKVIEDWKYVAMVLDRLFLWIFTVAVLVGTAGIILQAPTLYDDRQPLDIRLSQIGLATARPMAGVNKD